MDIQKLKGLAHLARIEISDSELVKTGQEMQSILNWVEQLKELDTSNVEPLLSTAQHNLPRREDIVKTHGQRQAVLDNAPDTDSEEHFFAVPKVVE
ncbi:MAG: Asp-tRNA(Asn)/Glu-tRNA(Gln) amidotransferase subunit GatC [Alphaproteobacteria bacterium]|nr:Asp-tRNA(Asn)/Glu-tRNA(Gln) amidotransferase subunit GatC [Alphaproteobacteria bacterium]